MTRDDLERWEEELRPLVPLEGASPFARQSAVAFNADADDVRGALLEPARRMLERGSTSAELAHCLLRTVAELAFWRRVLLAAHRNELRPERPRPEFLVRYLLS